MSEQYEKARKADGTAYNMSRDAKKDGNHSRRYRTNAAHTEAHENWAARKGASLDDAKDRVEMSERRKPSEQLARLDRRLGKGVGAAKERAKLKKRIEAGDKSREEIAEAKKKADEKKEKAKKKK